MKKYVILASAALLALAACNKVQETVIPEKQNEVSELIFTSAKPQFDADTRTAWDGEAIVWQTDDKIRIGYTLNSRWMGKSAAGDPKFYASGKVEMDENDNSIGTFTLPVDDNTFTDPQVDGTYQFYAFAPSSLTSSATVTDPEAQTFTVPVTQNPAAGTFDPTADILVGKSAAMDLTGFPSTPVELNWTRLVAHADITFSNMDFNPEGETVSKITLTFNEDAKVAGSFTANLAQGTAGPGDANTVAMEGEGVVVNGTSINAWCVVLPVAFTSLDVEIKTDKATYTRSISGLSGIAFKQNAHNTLTVNMQSAEKDVNLGTAYELYTGELTEGVYIIYDDAKGVAMKAEVDNNRFKAFSITPTDGVITTSEESIAWYIAPSGDDWTIYNSESGMYAVVVGGNNTKVDLSSSADDDKAKWTTESDYEFKNKSNSKYLRYNPGYGFAGYATSTGTKLTLYKFDSREPLDAPSSVTASLSPSVSNAIVVMFDEVDDAASYVITATPTGDGDVVTLANVTGSPATIEGLDYNTAYVISVYAVPASEDEDHKKSPATEAAEAVTTGPKPAAPEGYELVTSLNDVTTGLYIIAAKLSDNYIGMPKTLGTTPFAGSAVTVEDGWVSTNNASNFVLTFIESGGKFTIQGSTATLGYGSSTSFSTSATGNAALWTISAGTNGSFRIANVSVETRAVVYRAGTTKKFGAYSTSNITATSTEYYDVELFKYNREVVIKADPTLTVSPAPVSLEVGKTQQLTVDTNSDGAVTYETSDATVATVNNGLIEAVAAGSATITVKTAETETYNAAQKEISVTVTNGPSSIADVIAAASGVSVYTSGVVAQVNLKGFVITDGNDNIHVYQNATPSVAVGQSVAVKGTRGAYNNVAQINSPTITAGATGQTVTRTTLTTITSQNATGFTTNQYVSLTGTLTQSNNYYNISISGSTTQGSLYQVSSSATFTGGSLSELVDKVVCVTGYVTGSSNNYLNIAPVDIVESPDAPSLSVSPTSAIWASGENDEKTFTVTAENGTWDISAETVSTWATVTKNTSNNTIKVTPNTAQASTANSGTITITLTPTGTGFSSLTATINLSQAKYSSGPDWSTTYTSNVTLPVSGTNVSSCKVIISSVEYEGTKLGKSGSGASANVTIPAGTTKLYVHCATWNGKNASLSLSTTATGVTISPATDWSLTSDTGISGNSPFTLKAPANASTSYFKEYTLTGVNSDITIKFEAKDERAVFWGVNAD